MPSKSEIDKESAGPQLDLPDRVRRKALLREMAEAAQKGLDENAPGGREYAEYAQKMQALDRRWTSSAPWTNGASRSP